MGPQSAGAPTQPNGPPKERLVVWDSATLSIGAFLTFLCLFIVGFMSIFPLGFLAIKAIIPAALAGVFGIGMLVRGASRRITADGSGLAWRDMKGKHSAAWEDIADFYSVAPTSTTGRTEAITRYEIVTREGKTLWFTSEWTKSAELRQRVVERAENATTAQQPNGSRGWEVKGARPTDLPLTFHYDGANLPEQEKKAARHTLIKVGLLFALLTGIVVMVAPLLWNVISRPRLTGMLLLGWLGFQLALLASFGVVWIAQWFRGRRARRETRLRVQRTERFEATTQGLTFYQDGEARFAPWDSITGYDFVSKGLDETTGFGEWVWFSPLHAKSPICRVRMTDGKEFTLTNRITPFPVFQRLLRRYAPEAIESHIAANNKEALGGVAARWTGGEEGKGERVYHRYTRQTMVLLAATWLLGPGLLIFKLSAPVGENNPTDELMRLCFNLIPTLALIVWGVGTAMVTVQTILSRIQIGAEGITVKAYPKKQFIPWNAIRQVEQVGSDLLLWLHDGTKVSFMPMRYAYGSEIQGHIEERIRPFQKRVAQGDIPNHYQAQEESPVIQQAGMRGG